MTRKKPGSTPPPGELRIRNSTAEFLIFTRQAGAESIHVRLEDGSIWLSQTLMAELFGVDKRTVSEHLKNIFASGELDEGATLRNFRTVQTEGGREVARDIAHYNLDAIISVGYRVNSLRATQFRQWATQVLSEFAIKGYVLDRKRLENGAFLGVDYFERLLEEIREIRLSERRFYQKITDIYATAIDYNPNSPATREFFAKVQNKLHFAIHGHTAAELIHARADASQPGMGLVTWEKAPQGRILKTDVGIAKNYLTQDELTALGRIVNSYLDLAEDRAQRRQPMSMEDWAMQLDRFLELTERGILQNAGSISADAAKAYAEGEFEKYRRIQEEQYESDFDRVAKAGSKQLPEVSNDVKSLEKIGRELKDKARGKDK